MFLLYHDSHIYIERVCTCRPPLHVNCCRARGIEPCGNKRHWCTSRIYILIPNHSSLFAIRRIECRRGNIKVIPIPTPSICMWYRRFGRHRRAGGGKPWTHRYRTGHERRQYSGRSCNIKPTKGINTTWPYL